MASKRRPDKTARPDPIDLRHRATKRSKVLKYAKTGRYVIGTERRGPRRDRRKGRTEMAGKGGSSGKGSGRARDAGSGQYVTKKYADTHKKTTVVEHDKPKKK